MAAAESEGRADVEYPAARAEGQVLGHRTVDEMGRHELPVSPQNYEVWLTYFTHSSPDLRAAIDKLIAAGKAFTDARTWKSSTSGSSPPPTCRRR